MAVSLITKWTAAFLPKQLESKNNYFHHFSIRRHKTRTERDDEYNRKRKWHGKKLYYNPIDPVLRCCDCTVLYSKRGIWRSIDPPIGEAYIE